MLSPSGSKWLWQTCKQGISQQDKLLFIRPIYIQTKCINVLLTTFEELVFSTEELLDFEDSLLLDGDDERFLLLLLFTEDKEPVLFLASSANSAGANDSTMAFRALLSDTEDNSVTTGRRAENVIKNLQS